MIATTLKSALRWRAPCVKNDQLPVVGSGQALKLGGAIIAADNPEAESCVAHHNLEGFGLRPYLVGEIEGSLLTQIKAGVYEDYGGRGGCSGRHVERERRHDGAVGAVR
ncbi:hypothetical protein GCM10022295_92430 [Streptomyces osmaniensis]|uniref:Uncharacterized protein n=1 Tax=Streptomyces osmaniensis TaxID=593134 RepID=A0ABP6Z4P7_9ACTN